ncbi:MAG: DUF4097 family beta strand repeat-containing protein [Gemmatimonadaceae bacterium]
MNHRLLPFSALLAALVAIPASAQSGDFHWTGSVPSGGDVSVSNVSGEVRVTASTTGRVEVTGYKHGRDADRVRANVEQTSHGLVVCVLYDDASSCEGRNSSSGDHHGRNDASIDLEVSVPAAINLRASSVSGNVRVSGVQGDVDANSVSGNVNLDRLRAASIRANSVSGNIEVQADQLTGRGDLSFHTVSGDVSLELPRNFDADITMSTVSGSMDSDYQMTMSTGRMSRRSINARIGSGGRRLDLKTVSGDVKLRMGNK